MFGIVPKRLLVLVFFLFLCVAAGLGMRKLGGTAGEVVAAASKGEEEAFKKEIEKIFHLRLQALLSGDTRNLENYYDVSRTTGRWALNHEIGRTKYLQEWLGKRGIEIVESKLDLRIVEASLQKERGSASVAQHLILTYRPKGSSRDKESQMGFRTLHWVELTFKEGRWVMEKDWYWDPLEADDLEPDIEPTPSAAGEGLSSKSLPPGGGRYNRERAVWYARRYSGVRMGLGDGRYNPDYKDFTYEGGDCTNFASQVLTDKKAGGIPTDWNWFYSRGQATAAWVQAEALVHHLLYNGLAVLVKKGNLEEVWESVKLLEPGDIIGYEEKGEIAHISIVVGKDASGYTIVNSHTADRYHVPWDMGWDRYTTYWLLHITY
ncbi:MAG: amidase domain-containing protein [Thermanaeromonas sp.]|uniref:amidase domain-containing protein n=1 Tax=Thermanaeromonas sp. TaxID=2003697 RepID=UPI0024376DAE|nr:amidase domain-containing protein [Thermanaeromonas sp.]MCG0277764.1 amidase domain-containing protein [Thermanaeromonas sp.]